MSDAMNLIKRQDAKIERLERENAALREALAEARAAVAALTVEVRTIAPTSPHAALLARLDAALQPHAGDSTR